MSKDEIKGLIVLAAVFSLGCLCGFFTGKAVYQPTYGEKVTRDTVRVTDTVPHYYPRPVEKQVVRYVTRFLPVVKSDTINHFVEVSKMIDDTVAVEVPITSKHYGSKDYDAWVSGYEPSLDSIKVYQRTEYITERVTISKPPNRWELDLIGGINYNFNKKKHTPYAGGELLYKPNRLQVGLQGGIIKADKVEPVVGANVKIRIF